MHGNQWLRNNPCPLTLTQIALALAPKHRYALTLQRTMHRVNGDSYRAIRTGTFAVAGNLHLDHPTHPIPTKKRHCINLAGGVHPLNKIHMQRCFKGLRFSWNSLHETGHKNASAMGLVVWPPWDSLHGRHGIRCMATMGLVSWTECCFPANLQTGHQIHFMV